LSLERRDSEAWLDGLAEGIVLIIDGHVRTINAAAASMLGTARSHAAGLPLIAVVRDHRIERLWLDGQAQELGLRGRRIRVVPLPGALVLHDLTETRTAQENARELLAVLSHELRTPVTTIRSTLEALQYEELPADTRERLVERATEETDRLVRLLGDLTVDVAPPRERSVELSPLLERACAILARRLAEHRVEVRRNVADVAVWADPDKVLQVIVNLLENAAMHGPDRAPVDVVAEEADGWVSIRVRDRGAPLPFGRAEILFEPHARGDSLKAHGTGLGLYVVRSIAARWGGRAWGGAWTAQSQGGAAEQGNEFGVTVPASRSSVARAS